MGLLNCFGQPNAAVSPEPLPQGTRHEKQPLAERKLLQDSPALGAALGSTDASSVSPVSALGLQHYGDYRRSRRKSMEQDVLGATLELARQRRASSGYDASTSGQAGAAGKGLFGMDWGWLAKNKTGKRALKGPEEQALERPSRGRKGEGSVSTAEALQRRGFPVHYAKDIHKSVSTSTTKPIAVLGLDPATDTDGGMSIDPKASNDGTAGDGQRRVHNKLFPLYVNGVAKSYFKISASRDYAQVLRRLLRRDPLLTFALQKAIKSLSMGDCKPVSHVTSDPTGASASLYGLRITPCVWSDTNGHKLPALLLEHNVPYESQDVMPRLLRDYAVLSHVPSILTLIDFNGHVLYQNAASIDYCGDLTSHNVETGDGMLGVLFQYDPQMLQEMLQEVNEGNYWQQVVRVPASLKRHMIFEAENNWGHGSRGGGKKLTAAVSKRFIQDALEPEFQLESFTTQNARSQRNNNRKVTPVFQNQVSIGMQRQESVAQRGGPARQDTRESGVAISGPAALPVGRLQSVTGAVQQRLASHSLAGNNPTHVAFNLPNQLEDGQSSSHHITHGGSFSTGVSKASAPTQHSHLANPAQNRRFMTLMQSAAAAERQQPSFTGSLGSFHTEGEKPDSRQAGPSQEECWHDISAIPLLDPVLDKQVILLLQSNVTARVELENRLADLTDAQLGMLEQLFPRHVIEYMLSHKHGYNSRNLTHLANHHDDVIVLFTDVVGFTSMSKEVEPSEVMHFLNELYTIFDDLVDMHDLYKLDTVGDCYIVVAGLTMQDDDGFTCTVQGDNEQRLQHAQVMMDFAKAILRESKQVLMPHNHNPVQIRIGIHLGSLASGLVGPKMPKFTLFGDTMNTASRMESTCKPGCVQVSEAFASLLPLEDWLDTGGVEVKGKGLMQTYLWIPKPEDLAPMQRSALPRDNSMESLDEVRAPAPSTMSSALTTAPDDSAADRTEVDGTMRSSAASPARPKSSRPYSSRHRPKSSRFARPTTARLRQSRDGGEHGAGVSRPSTAGSSHGGLSRAPSIGRTNLARSMSRRNVSFRFRSDLDDDDEVDPGQGSNPLMAILNAIRGGSGTGEGDDMLGSTAGSRRRELLASDDSEDEAPRAKPGSNPSSKRPSGGVRSGPHSRATSTAGDAVQPLDALEGVLDEMRNPGGYSGSGGRAGGKAVRVSLAPDARTDSRNSPGGRMSVTGGRPSQGGDQRGSVSNLGGGGPSGSGGARVSYGGERLSQAGGPRPSNTGDMRGASSHRPSMTDGRGSQSGAVPQRQSNSGATRVSLSGARQM